MGTAAGAQGAVLCGGVVVRRAVGVGSGSETRAVGICVCGVPLVPLLFPKVCYLVAWS